MILGQMARFIRVCVKFQSEEVVEMPREKKDSKNFTCKFDRKIFEKLEEFCELSGQSKTTVVERSVQKYLNENMELIREVAKKL